MTRTGTHMPDAGNRNGRRRKRAGRFRASRFRWNRPRPRQEWRTRQHWAIHREIETRKVTPTGFLEPFAADARETVLNVAELLKRASAIIQQRPLFRSAHRHRARPLGALRSHGYGLRARHRPFAQPRQTSQNPLCSNAIPLTTAAPSGPDACWRSGRFEAAACVS